MVAKPAGPIPSCAALRVSASTASARGASTSCSAAACRTRSSSASPVAHRRFPAYARVKEANTSATSSIRSLPAAPRRKPRAHAAVPPTTFALAHSVTTSSAGVRVSPRRFPFSTRICACRPQRPGRSRCRRFSSSSMAVTCRPSTPSGIGSSAASTTCSR